MPHNTNSETVLRTFKRYIDAFNNCDIDEIERQLNVDVEVEFNGSVASRGRDTILPDYLKDFKIGRKVEIIRGPLLKNNGSTVDVDVTYVTTVPDVEVVQLDVVYTYEVKSMTQVRHIITNVKTLSSEST